MNHIYKTVWNPSINSWVATSELASSSKNKNSKNIKYENKITRIIPSLMLLVCTASGAQSIIASGDTSPSSFSGNTYSTNNNVEVGNYGVGDLKIKSGGTFTAGTFTIGNFNGGNGSVTVDGASAVMNVKGTPMPTRRFLHVGHHGSGTLNIINGGEVTVGDGSPGYRIVVGYWSDGNGTVNISGAGSKLTVVNGYIMVAGGPGSVSVRDGGTLDTAGGYIGQEHSPNTIFTISGAGSSWQSTDTIYMDSAGSAKFTIDDGGLVNTTSLYLGTFASNNPLGAIDVVVSGDQSQLVINELKINRGSISVSSEGEMQTSSAAIGASGGSNLNASTLASVSVDGIDTTWSNANAISMGGGPGQSKINVTNGGSITSASLSMDGRGKNSIAITGVGSSLELSGSLSANTGTIQVDNGGFLKSNNSSIGVSAPDGLSASVTVSGAGSSWVNTQDIIVGGGAGNAILNASNQGVIQSANIIANQNSRITGDSTIKADVTLNSGSTIAPHSNTSNYSTLKIEGDLLFNSGSTYEVSGDSISNLNDVIVVTGNANITDGNLHITASGTTYQLGTYYTVLTAQTLTGTFKNVSANYEFLDAAVDYQAANTVRIGLVRNNVNLVDVALTPNQKSTAAALTVLNTSGILDEYISTIPKGSAPAAFDAVSGEIHATLRSSLLGWSQHASESGLDQLRTSMMASATPCSGEAEDAAKTSVQKPSSCKDRKSFTGWAQVVGNWNQTNTDGNAAKSKSNTGGVLLGTDYGLGTSGWRIGGMFGYGKSSVKSHARRSSADLHNYTLGVHAGKRFDWGAEHVNVMGGISYTHHSIKTNRNIPRVDELLQAKYSGHTVQAFGEVGYVMAPVSRWKLEPFMGLNVTKQKVGSFEETGGIAGVHSKAESKTYTTAMLGLHAQSNMEVSGKPLQLRGTVGLKQALGNKEITRTMAFNQGSPDYLIWGVPRSSSTMVLGIHAQMALTPSATLEAGFNGEFGKKVREQALQARVRWAF